MTYLTVKDVAELLQVREERVYSWINSGDLQAVNIVKDLASSVRPRYRVSRKSLDAFLRRRTSVSLASRRGLEAVLTAPDHLGINK